MDIDSDFDKPMQEVVKSIKVHGVEVLFDKFPVGVKTLILAEFDNKIPSRKAIMEFLLRADYFQCNNCKTAFSEWEALQQHLKRKKEEKDSHYVNNEDFQRRCEEYLNHKDASQSINAENLSKLLLDICTRIRFRSIKRQLQQLKDNATVEELSEQVENTTI